MVKQVVLDHVFQSFEWSHLDSLGSWLRWDVPVFLNQWNPDILTGRLSWFVFDNDLAQTRNRKCSWTLLADRITDQASQAVENCLDILFGDTAVFGEAVEDLALREWLNAGGFLCHLRHPFKDVTGWKLKQVDLDSR